MEHWTLEPLTFEFWYQGSYVLQVARGSVAVKTKGETYKVPLEICFFYGQETFEGATTMLTNAFKRASTSLQEPPFSVGEYLDIMLSHPTDSVEGRKFQMSLAGITITRPFYKKLWENVTAKLDKYLDQVSTWLWL